MAHEIYMHLDSIMGECNEIYHKNWIVLDGFSCSITSAFNDETMSGACEHGEMSISKLIDRSSPKLALATCNLTRFNEGIIHVCNQNATGQINSIVLECLIRGVRFLTYELSGEDTSTDSISLRYETIEWRYSYLDPHSLSGRGRIVTRWDTTSNSGG